MDIHGVFCGSISLCLREIVTKAINGNIFDMVALVLRRFWPN